MPLVGPRRAKGPACGMTVEPGNAAATAEHQGTMWKPQKGSVSNVAGAGGTPILFWAGGGPIGRGYDETACLGQRHGWDDDASYSRHR